MPISLTDFPLPREEHYNWEAIRNWKMLNLNISYSETLELRKDENNFISSLSFLGEFRILPRY
jgi:hypothetical protein